MDIVFDTNSKHDAGIEKAVQGFLGEINTLERTYKMPIVVFQDGVKGAYYIKCSILAKDASSFCDLNAKLDVDNPEGFRANRELLLTHATYLKMRDDAGNGREFNDIIVEYNKDYGSKAPLKVWGGQHRIRAIKEAVDKKNRYHGFKIYFSLSKQQRTEVALISNTNISVSNDTFDRMVEETIFGNVLRDWCWEVGLMTKGEGFPDAASKSEKITVKKARCFVVNFYLGLEKGEGLSSDQLDRQVYDPYLPTSGASVDECYSVLMKKLGNLNDDRLMTAGKKFAVLHKAQYDAVKNKKSKIKNSKAFRNKAMIESVLSGWSFVAGLLQAHSTRLVNHYRLSKSTQRIPDPLNATEMSQFKHDQDPPTYRGLGTRSSLKDRQRIAQLFLAKSREKEVTLDKGFMTKAVSQTVGLIALKKGYA
jgi:hypothetical protein